MHSGQFKGGQCSKLLDNIETSDKILKSKFEVVPDELKMLMHTMKALNNVKKTCFGLSLGISYKNSIDVNKEAYMSLNEKVSPKVHAIVIHAPAFLESMAYKYPGKGLVFWSEQTSESVHNDFKQFYEQGYKVPSCHNCVNQNC